MGRFAAPRTNTYSQKSWKYSRSPTILRGRQSRQSVAELVERPSVCLVQTEDAHLLKDLRYSLRTLRKMPGFSIVALLVLALGIGANTAIFSVVNSVVLRPLPYPGADRLALIWETDLKDGIKREGPSAPNFLDWKEQSQSFEEMALLEVGTGTADR